MRWNAGVIGPRMDETNNPQNSGVYFLPEQLAFVLDDTWGAATFGTATGGVFTNNGTSVTEDWADIAPENGDLVIIFAVKDSSQAVSYAGAGFTNLSILDAGCACYCGHQVCDGTETGTITVWSSGGANGCAVWIKIPSATMDTSPSEATNSVGMPNPPSRSSMDTAGVALAVGYLDDDNVTMTAPSGYTMAAATYANSTGSAVAVAYKFNPASTEDPAVFGGGGTDSWVACTFDISEA